MYHNVCTQVDHYCSCETGAAILSLSSALILITRQNGLTCCLCIQIDRFGPCECLSLTLVLSDLGSVKFSLHSNILEIFHL